MPNHNDMTEHDVAGCVPHGSSLRSFEWDVGYSHEDGDLVKLFFVPALSRATLYRRATGYFSAGVMALAARGLDALIDCGGRMQLLVGCTLSEEDAEQIQKGYDIRTVASRSDWAKKLVLPDDNAWARQQLGYLAWMIARGCLDVQLAIPLDENGQMRAGLSLYHAKMGIITDEHGDELVFKGSINETPQGWLSNCESFDVSCSWRGDWDGRKVAKANTEFTTLWTGKARSARVVEFPQALKEQLLEFLPKDDKFVRPPKSLVPDDETPDETPEPVPPPPVATAATNDERQRLVWSFIKNAPKRPDGAMVAVLTSAVKPWPHQLRAYKRMLDSWPLRLLVADEVGLGKTIEAGLIIRHAWIAELARRILIMVPKAVLQQWQSELYEKFNLLVPIYTGSSLVWPEHHARTMPLEQKIGRNEWTKQPLVLVSSHLMRRRDRQQELLDAADWDLLVLDEAHHARRRSPGTPQEGGPNRLLRLMQQIKDKAKSLLLMTATPMQVHPVEIWDLLNLLGLPEPWTAKAFVDYFDTVGRNPDAAQLQQVCRLFQATEQACGQIPESEIERIGNAIGLGAIQQKKVVAALRECDSTIPLKKLTNQQRQMALALLKTGSPVRHRMSRHTRNLLRQYHKRGLLNTPIPDRDVIDWPVELSPAERALYEAVEDYISDTYEKAEPDKKTAVGFVMTIYRRRLASSFHALKHTLSKRLEQLDERQRNDGTDEEPEEDVSQDETADEVMEAEEALAYEREALKVEEREEILALLRGIAKLGTDTKALRLLDKLKDAFQEGYDSALIFTQYTDTMDFLRDFLAERLNMPIGCFSARGGETRDTSGAWVRCSKEQIKRKLRTGEVRLLVCSDAAAEGLNLQSCGVLANYDLPWNPMKVEQRIGRIDRIGQRHPKVRIINLAYADTVEADVYFALSRRINLFQGVVGKLQPILSKLPKEFEQAALRRRAERERGRHEAAQHVQTLVREAEVAAFDIDEVSDADLTPPSFPPAPYAPADVAAVLRCSDLLPPGIECSELEPSTFRMCAPGRSEPARVTADPDIFDEHFESHQMVAADSPLFRELLRSSGSEADPAEISAVTNLTDFIGGHS